MNHATLFCSPVISSFVALNLHDSQTAPARLELYCLTPAAAPRNATFHFSAVSHQTLSCGVDKPKWFACVLTWRRPSLFQSSGPSRWIKLCKSVQNGAWLLFFFFFNPPATLWLTFHESNPLNLQHNGCHCTIALAIFHTEQPQSGETPCVQWVLAGLLARWERRRLSHTCGFSFF